jgi:hypothetical protein
MAATVNVNNDINVGPQVEFPISQALCTFKLVWKQENCPIWIKQNVLKISVTFDIHFLPAVP